MSSTTPTSPWPLPELTRARRAIVVVDVVESVRLMQEDEAGFIDRWRRFVHEVRTEVLPQHSGALIKSLGDGLLLAFDHAHDAARASFVLHDRVAAQNAANDVRLAIWLRAGIHTAEVVMDALDVYGVGVNLAARLAAMAKVGETMVSIDVRDQLTDGLDLRACDMGECYLKHIDQPVRAFVLRPVSSKAILPRSAPLLPRLTVLPVRLLGEHQSDELGIESLARVLTDDLVSTLSSCPHWQVMSRLSTAALHHVAHTPTIVQGRLDTDFWVWGELSAHNGRLRLCLRATESRSGALLWECVQTGPCKDLAATHIDVVMRAAAALGERLLARQLSLSQSIALPNLPNYSLLLGAISLLHRLGGDDIERAKALLTHLAQRNPRAPEAQVWMAKWLFLQVAQRRTDDAAATVRQADEHLSRALDADPKHAMALALTGHLRIYAKADPDNAVSLLRQAAEVGPNESLAWLFLSNALAATGAADEAVVAVDRACALSPLDPLGYYYDVFAASAYSAAGQHAQALALAERSVERNALHLSSWVQLIIEQVLNNQVDDARRTAEHYLALRPNASVQRFSQTHTARGTALADRDARALIEAGLPW
jgi:adenylate cyclase